MRVRQVNRDEISFLPLAPDRTEPLIEFFATVTSAGIDRVFHPHPFDAAEARCRTSYIGRDEYHIGEHRGSIVAYGMLRGWDEGYVVPSLGIVVHPDWQGCGIGRRMMEYLHDVARRRGAAHVRLKVYPDNEAALSLYERLGYDFAETQQGQRVGVFTL
jgi:ribosomal protein S18 acetylase RimI-like enzyme